MKLQNKDLVLLIIVVGFSLLLVGSHCTIENVVGIPCPGCNMFTAIYYLFRLDLNTALYYHPLCILCVIYLIILLIAYIKNYAKVIKISSYIFISLLIIVYVYRMITIYPNAPMGYNKDSILNKLLNL